MTAVRSLLFNLYFYGLTTVMAVAGLPLLLGPRGWVAGWRDLWVRLSLAGLAAIAGLRHQVTGGDRLAAGPFLVAAQHQSAWETLALHSVGRRPGPGSETRALSHPAVRPLSRQDRHGGD